MNSLTAKIVCRTPTPGKQATRIDKWKYDRIRGRILDVIPADNTGIEFKNLAHLVTQGLSQEEIKRIGSISWYTTTVKLDMEVAGEITRIPGSNPQRLRKKPAD